MRHMRQSQIVPALSILLVLMLFQNCGQSVGFDKAGSKGIAAQTSNDSESEQANIEDLQIVPIETEIVEDQDGAEEVVVDTPVVKVPSDNNQNVEEPTKEEIKYNYTCKLDTENSRFIGLVGGRLNDVKTPAEGLCMSKGACTEIMTDIFKVKYADKDCPNGTTVITDDEARQLVDNMKQPVVNNDPAKDDERYNYLCKFDSVVSPNFVGLIDGRLNDVRDPNKALCMSKKACTDIMSQVFKIKSADKDCPKDTTKVTDKEAQALVDDIKRIRSERDFGYICLLNSKWGNAIHIGLVNENLDDVKGVHYSACMSKKACTDIMSIAFDVKEPKKAAFCQSNEPQIFKINDSEAVALVSKLKAK